MTLDARHLPLLRELGDLKRIRSADRAGSIAERLFVAAWSALVAGADWAATMRSTTAAALAAARLGDLDHDRLRALGLDHGETAQVLARSFDEVTAQVDGDLKAALRGALAAGAPRAGDVPRFVTLLADQPRAGVTAPGLPRVILQPAENHAEHCLIVAVYGVLAAPGYGADPVTVFAASLAHHFHNAYMPDSGFSGEVLLGERLDPVIADARERALREFDADLADRFRSVLAPIATDDTAEARAFHAADVLDRVLEIEQHVTRSAVTMERVLGTYGLVHDGPVKAFHDEVLRGADLP